MHQPPVVVVGDGTKRRTADYPPSFGGSDAPRTARLASGAHARESEAEAKTDTPTAKMEAGGHTDPDPGVGSHANAALREPFKVGDRLEGIYLITSRLGGGGMGSVYEAQDLSLNRLVAVKVAHDERCAHALRLEAQALAALHHPNVVTVHALGRHHGVDFLVMERLFGTPIDALIDRALDIGEPIPLDEVLFLAAAMADGLSAVHRAGLAHRDVKPSNVIVSGERVVLADFGLVTPEVELSGPQPETVAGSADYMAPEIICRDVRPGHGPAVDLYALGIVTFELLTGHPPYTADSVDAILRAHVASPVVDPRTRRPECPESLAQLVMELCAKAPDDRPETAEEVVWRLAAIREGLGLSPGVAPMRVLVVDDDPGVGRLLKRRLELAMPRMHVESVTSAHAAKRELARAPVELLLVDLNMPDESGVELCMELSGLPRRQRPRIVAISAEASDEDVKLLFALGVQTFVPKGPSFAADVAQVVGELRAERQRQTSKPRRTSSH